MLRSIKIIILFILMVAIVVLALANRQMVEVKLLPEGLDQIYPASLSLPLYAVSILSILVGLLIGYILEYLREHRYRKTAARSSRQVAKLEREVSSLKKQNLTEEEQILELLD